MQKITDSLTLKKDVSWRKVSLFTTQSLVGSSKVYSYRTLMRQFMATSAHPLFQIGENSIEVIGDLLDLAFLSHQILLDLVNSDVQSANVHF